MWKSVAMFFAGFVESAREMFFASINHLLRHSLASTFFWLKLLRGFVATNAAVLFLRAVAMVAWAVVALASAAVCLSMARA